MTPKWKRFSPKCYPASSKFESKPVKNDNDVFPKRLLREGSVNSLHHGAPRPLPGSAGAGRRHGGVAGRGRHPRGRGRAGARIGEARGPRPPPTKRMHGIKADSSWSGAASGSKLANAGPCLPLYSVQKLNAGPCYVTYATRLKLGTTTERRPLLRNLGYAT